MAKKQAAKKKAAKKSASRGSVTATKRAAKKYVALPSGYRRSSTGTLAVPVKTFEEEAAAGVVPAGKLQAGIKKASEQISEVLQQLADAAAENFEITEIELAASFSADGKFMGFGVGGEMSITFRVKPTG
jgi:hypothetical protein